MAPTIKNGIAIINNVLGLKARPNESPRTSFQPGQANKTAGLNNVMAANRRKIANLILGITAKFFGILALVRTLAPTRFEKFLKARKIMSKSHFKYTSVYNSGHSATTRNQYMPTSLMPTCFLAVK